MNINEPVEIEINNKNLIVSITDEDVANVIKNHKQATLDSMSDAIDRVKVDTIKNDMLDKIQDMFNKRTEVDTVKVPEVIPPLEEALIRALYTLNEIVIYASYNRTEDVQREAKEAFDVLCELKTKHDNQVKMWDALKNTPNEEVKP
jgi:hypothetical protein